MSSGSFNKKITLRCPTCGNTWFEYDNAIQSNIQKIKCSSCKGVFSRDELMRLNKNIINKNIKDMEKEITDKIEKDLDKILNKL